MNLPLGYRLLVMENCENKKINGKGFVENTACLKAYFKIEVCLTYKKTKHFTPFYSLARGLIIFVVLTFNHIPESRQFIPMTGSTFVAAEPTSSLRRLLLSWCAQCLAAVIQRASLSWSFLLSWVIKSI